MEERKHKHAESYWNPGLYARVDKDNQVLRLSNHSRVDDCEFLDPDLEAVFPTSEEEQIAMDKRNKKVLDGAFHEFRLSFKSGLKIARELRRGRQVYLTAATTLSEKNLDAWIFGKNAKVKIEHVESNWHNPQECERHDKGIRFYHSPESLISQIYLSW